MGRLTLCVLDLIRSGPPFDWQEARVPRCQEIQYPTPHLLAHSTWLVYPAECSMAWAWGEEALERDHLISTSVSPMSSLCDSVTVTCRLCILVHQLWDAAVTPQLIGCGGISCVKVYRGLEVLIWSGYPESTCFYSVTESWVTLRDLTSPSLSFLSSKMGIIFNVHTSYENWKGINRWRHQ